MTSAVGRRDVLSSIIIEWTDGAAVAVGTIVLLLCRGAKRLPEHYHGGQQKETAPTPCRLPAQPLSFCVFRKSHR